MGFGFPLAKTKSLIEEKSNQIDNTMLKGVDSISNQDIIFNKGNYK